MPTLAPPSLVQGAARVPLPYGLFSVLAFRPEDSDRWQGGGVQWEYLLPEEIEILGPLQNQYSGTGQASGLPKNFDSNSSPADPGFTSAIGFTVYGRFKHSPTAWPPERAQARALDNLLAFEEAKVEAEFWAGTAGSSPDLAGNNVYVGNYSQEQLIYALADLEQFIATSYGSLGVIHMARKYGSILASKGALRRDGNRMTTEIGTPVVLGTGYPLGQMKATPALFGYRSAPFFSSDRAGDLLDTRNNDMYAIAERTYLIGFDPTGVGAVDIDPDSGE